MQRASPNIIVFDRDRRLDFEILISEVSSRFVHSSQKELESVIDESLQKILFFLQMDRAALFTIEDGANGRFVLSHLKVQPGCGPQMIPDLTTDSFPWMTQELLSGRETRYSRIDELPEEAFVDKETLRKFGPKYSAMAMPLFDSEQLVGILALGIAEEIRWPEELPPRLRVVAHIFAGALIRMRTEERLRQTMIQLEELRIKLEHENVYLRQEAISRTAPTELVYRSEAMASVLSKVAEVAPVNATVLLSGETGTGKERIATAIHQYSSRAERTMVRVNCGAIPAALVESEMFGREKGAYTGALSRQAGRFELANNSTIFLDEITELPLEVQVKLLRVLQEKEIERLGNPKPIRVDVRIIAATNQNLEKAVQEGRFRQDLFYRLNVFPIEVPPLRDRLEDIPLLAWNFVDELSVSLGKKVEKINPKSMDALMKYSWPGNVRELRNLIERAMITMHSTTLTVELPRTTFTTLAANRTLKDSEIRHIRKVLESCGWRIRGKQGAAEILGMKPTTLETRMSKLGITRPQK